MIAPTSQNGHGWLLQQVTGRFGHDLSGRILSAWGLFGVPGRDAAGSSGNGRGSLTFEFADPADDLDPSELVDALLARGARVKAHGAPPSDEVRERFGDQVTFCDASYRCLIGADALLVHGDGRPYRRPDFHRIMVLLQTPVIFDDRALYAPDRLRELGFEYYSVGREPVIPAGRAASDTQNMTGAPRASGSVGPIVVTKDGPLSAGPGPG